MWEEIADAYRCFPHLHGNREKLALLLAVQSNLDKSLGDTDDAIAAAEEESYEEGKNQGYKSALEEFLEPIDFSAQVLFDALEGCVITDEAADAIKGLRREIDDMDKALSR